MGSSPTPRTGTRRAPADANGLADHVAAVRTARAQLGRDLDQLDSEVRAQMSKTSERLLWNLVGTGLAVLSGVLVRKIVVALWNQFTDHEPPTNPGAPDTTWGEALGFALASGAAVGVARVVAARGATAGWQKVMGTLPPYVSDVDR
jgi:Protein of unknown function (DUF4235)